MEGEGIYGRESTAERLASKRAAAAPLPASADMYDDPEKERKWKAQQQAEDGGKNFSRRCSSGAAARLPN